MDILKIRNDFPVLRSNPNLAYLDSAAMALKPDSVIDAVDDYYRRLGVNVHRGVYGLSYEATDLYEEARETIAKFINASFDEVVFTRGASASLNLVAQSYGMSFIEEGDEVITTPLEHHSSHMPWINVCQKKKATLKYVPLDKDGRITVEAFKSVLTEKTKVVAITHVSNVMGYITPIKEIIKLAHEVGAIVSLDGAQSVPHMAVDVKDLDCDFLSFSGHKLCGPTGIGILYGKYDLLLKTSSISYGGGMNAKFDNCQNMLLKKPPYRFEGGTPAIAEVIGFARAIDYLNEIGMDNIHNYEKELKEYAVKRLKELDNVIIYNDSNESGIITFNIKDVFCQDAGTFFNSKGIAVRSGHHCAKLLPNHLHVIGTVRASLYFYNTKEEIDIFVETCKHGGDFLDAFFK